MTNTSDFLNKLALPEVIRVRGGSTSTDLDFIINSIDILPDAQFIFGVRDDHLNGKCLILIIKMKETTLVMDHTYLNAARDHRSSEITFIFKTIFEKHPLKSFQYSNSVIDDVEENDLPPEYTLALIKDKTLRDLTEDTLKNYYSMLSKYSFEES
jgi:hypothetical protein